MTGNDCVWIEPVDRPKRRDPVCAQLPPKRLDQILVNVIEEDVTDINEA